MCHRGLTNTDRRLRREQPVRCRGFHPIHPRISHLQVQAFYHWVQDQRSGFLEQFCRSTVLCNIAQVADLSMESKFISVVVGQSEQKSSPLIDIATYGYKSPFSSADSIFASEFSSFVFNHLPLPVFLSPSTSLHLTSIYGTICYTHHNSLPVSVQTIPNNFP